MNFGSKGMSGKVLQYLTLQTKSVRRSPGPPPPPLLPPAPADPGRRRSAAFCGGLTVGGIYLKICTKYISNDVYMRRKLWSPQNNQILLFKMSALSDGQVFNFKLQVESLSVIF